MKKFILIAISWFTILCTTACSDNETSYHPSSAIIFTRSQCQRTHFAIDFFKQLQQKDSNITYELKDLSVGENRILLKKLAKQHYLSKKAVPTPIIFTARGYTLGWDDKTEEALKSQLNTR